MGLLFGSIRGRKALAWLKHRRFAIAARSEDLDAMNRVDEAGNLRIAEDGTQRTTEEPL